MSLKEKLRSGEKLIGIWGLGYIGFSSMAYFAKAGIHCLGTDVHEQRIKDVNKGKPEIPNMEYWLAFDTKQLAEAGLMKATLDWKELINENVIVHLVAIPTEKEGKPYFEYLKDVCEKLSNFKDMKTDIPPLIIIESTLTLDAVEKIVFPLFEKKGLKIGKDILVGVAPRRDWFVSPDKTLETLPRVVGGTTKETTELMTEVMGIICNTVLKARDHRHSAIVKSVENAFRQLDITFANQLSLAYPDMDMVEILKLVGTKWNINTYHPSFGTGGYCIPLAPQYVIEGAKKPEELTLLKESLKTDFSHPEKVVKSLVRKGVKKVGVLGITYTCDLKVHVLSPAIPIIKGLKENKIEVKVQDPYYNDEEIKKLVDTETFKFPEGLGEFDCIIIVPHHMQYRYASTKKIIDNLTNCKLILDNMGCWSNIKFPETIEYHEAGDANWLE